MPSNVHKDSNSLKGRWLALSSQCKWLYNFIGRNVLLSNHRVFKVQLWRGDVLIIIRNCHLPKGIKLHNTHATFWKSVTKVTPFSNKGPILHRYSISFHLSHQPPLTWMCHFCVVKVTHLLHKKWHVTFKGGWWLKWKLTLSRWRNGL